MPTTTIPVRFRSLAKSAAAESGLPLKVVAAQIDEESGWNPSAVSPAGAQGIAQFEPGTWSSWGQGSPDNPKDAFPAYASYMKSLLGQYHGNIRDALAAYNAGPGNLSAGYGYADTILQAAGVPQSADAGKGSSRGPYGNPFRDVQNLTPERIDQGVDYSGTGPVYALGPGTIVATHNSGWPGGNFIAEKLGKGPLAGKYVYTAEDITPSVKVGQKVNADTVIGTMFDGGSGIETGFAAPPPSLGAAAGRSQFSGANSTAYGKAYSDVLSKLGAPGGIVQAGGVSGSSPSWLDKALGALQAAGGNFTGGAETAGGVPSQESSLAKIADGFGKIGDAIDWFLQPGDWVRLFCGLGGGLLFIIGIATLTGVGSGFTQAVAGAAPGVGQGLAQGAYTAEKPLRLPLGIAEAGFGGVLLVMAFHNFSGQGVSNWSEFLGYVSDRVVAIRQEGTNAFPSAS